MLLELKTTCVTADKLDEELKVAQVDMSLHSNLREQTPEYDRAAAKNKSYFKMCQAMKRASDQKKLSEEAKRPELLHRRKDSLSGDVEVGRGQM